LSKFKGIVKTQAKKERALENQLVHFLSVLRQEVDKLVTEHIHLKRNDAKTERTLHGKKVFSIKG